MGFLPKEDIVFSNDANQITTALQNNGLEDATHFAHLRFSGAFPKDYLYVSDTQHEYFIPVAKTSAKDGVNASLTTEASVSERTKQTTDDILSQFGDELKPTNTKKVPKGQIILGGSGGGAPTTPASSLPLGLYLIFGCGAVMLIGLGWMIYRKKATA